MAEAGITLYVIGCEPAMLQYRDFFMALAHITGGQYCALGDAAQLSSVIVGGVREEMAVERLMADVEAEVSAAAPGASEEEQASRVYQAMKARNVKTTQLKAASGNSAQISPAAIALSKKACLADVAKDFTPTAYSAAAYPAPMASSARMSARPMRAMAMAAPVMAMSAMSVSAPAPAAYTVEEDSLSMDQARRMVSKAAARSSKKAY